MLHKGIPVFSRRTAINHCCLGDMSQISDSASHIKIPFILQDDPHNPLHLFSWHDTTVSPLCSHGNSELFDEPLGVKELLTPHGPTDDRNPSAHAFQHGIPAAVADESARGRMRQDEKLRCPSCDHQASPGGIAFESFREQRLRGALSFSVSGGVRRTHMKDFPLPWSPNASSRIWASDRKFLLPNET